MSVEIITGDGITDREVKDGFPQLTPAEWELLAQYETREQASAGTNLYAADEPEPDLFLIHHGEVEIIGYPAEKPEGVPILRYGPGAFAAEFSILTGQRSLVTARVTADAEVGRVTQKKFRTMLADETELADRILKALVARRDALRSGVTADTLLVVGDARLRDCIDMRTYLARQRMPFRWIDSESPDGALALQRAGATVADLPVVLSPVGNQLKATPGQIAERLGLTYPPRGDRTADLVVVGAGPAGMAAAVYGASEGLSTIVLEHKSVGGQAAQSARIENYLGFPEGISGADLLERARLQAVKFGAEIYAPCSAARLHADGDRLGVALEDGTLVNGHAVIIATGAMYRRLPLKNWDLLEKTSIYYAATDLQAQVCAGKPVVVIGGANSAGQASLFLAASGAQVTLVARSPLEKDMSSYLVDRVRADRQIRVLENSSVTALHGDPLLTGVEVTPRSGDSEKVPATALFCFIGAAPATQWLSGVQLDADGFIVTDTDVDTGGDGPWSVLGRHPLPLETSVPGVFAVGDVRSGSMKRVASAVGEGSSAVHSVHRVIGVEV